MCLNAQEQKEWNENNAHITQMFQLFDETNNPDCFDDFISVINRQKILYAKKNGQKKAKKQLLQLITGADYE